MSSSTAIAARRSPKGDIFLAAEGRAAIASVPGLHDDFRPINEHL